ncbi:NAD(P)/FAD-dependent oxidoreductase [Jatrophihabitans telluris]|uniref:NADH:ubiquinone reductase (non-electrogenic) n=1 Tax=Jatrophihabitans telluris TaxID=2038343 RepID=A0ABY4R1P4_9ACTN|nr:NAD(P)/FAD-dependent oxidoreductase [Jatrophihabitans telluris]UQX89056.1 NAD(P)/FAD-dependent oxidoreductase [Jatrophihabitans telluris]
MTSQSIGQRHQVVIIGSGFGGLFAAKALGHANLDVTMISRLNHHLFQPLLYQVATGILSEGEVAPPTRDILRKQKNAQVLLGDVTAIDVQERTVTSSAAGITTVTPYDTLIVAAGADTSYFGHPEYAQVAPGLKSIDDAMQIRARIFGAFEAAELEPDATKRAEWLTFVAVGAGPTGVEMAGQLSEVAHRTLRGNFRAINPADARIILVDAADLVLGSFGYHLSAKTVTQLQNLGVEVWLNSMVKGVDATGIDVVDSHGEASRINSRCVVWAAGVQASPLGRSLGEQTGATVDRAGRIEVNPDLTLPGHPEIFVVGDMISLNNYPGVAQVAIQGGKYAADQIDRRVRGRAAKGPFKYFDKGSMATISRFQAVASVGRIRLFGFVAWLLWLGVHIFYLVGFKNRIATVFHWAISFLGDSRAQRAGVLQEAKAHPPVQAPATPGPIEQSDGPPAES